MGGLAVKVITGRWDLTETYYQDRLAEWRDAHDGPEGVETHQIGDAYAFAHCGFSALIGGMTHHACRVEMFTAGETVTVATINLGKEETISVAEQIAGLLWGRR